MQGSRDKLKEVLQEKLHEFEVKVPRTSEEFVFANISKAARPGFPKTLLYSAVALLSLSAYLFYNNSIADVQANLPHVSEKVHPEMGFAPVSNSEKSKSNEPVVVNKTAMNLEAQPEFISRDERRTESALVAQNEEHTAGLVSNEENVRTMTETPIPEGENEKLAERELPATSQEDPYTIIQPKRTGRFRFNASIMPLLAFSHVIPNADGVGLSQFHSAGSLNPSRIGGRIAFTVDYAIHGNSFLYAGVSYFNYNTQFGYTSSESIGDLAVNNAIDQRTSGFGLSAGARYPLKISPQKRRLISAGIESQLFTGQHDGLTSSVQLMLNAGYATELIMSKGFVRIQPTISYSITSVQYPGLRVHPYWVGFDVAYVWSR